MKYELVLFDLDGTLLNTSLGIFNSVRYVEKQMGFKRLDDKLLKQFIGPPPKVMYKKIYGISDAAAVKATYFHREYGAKKAIYEAIIYDNIDKVLQYIKNKGVKAGVATLKSQHIAEKVLDIVGIKEFFDVIVGMDESESLTKYDIIKSAIHKTSTKGKVLMVGDSQYDYEGAVKADVDFIGVLYGFGFSYGKHYPFYTVDHAKQLISYIV